MNHTMRYTALFLAIAAAQLPASADSIASRLMKAADPILRVPSLAFSNPVLMGVAADVSLSCVGARVTRSTRSDDPQRGTGSKSWQLGANTYTHSGNFTLWGNAAYGSGHTRDVVWNETADMDIIYPYLTADSVGGNINSERYSFSGGCARIGHTWGWGVAAGYTAAQHYRNVDPRPRDITGLLDVSVGGTRLIYSDYMAAVSLSLRRYTQSCDIDFKSEMGVDKVYHLTGLDNHYVRFAGMGLSSHYSGCRYGVAANIFPSSRRGLSVSVEASRFTFSKVLDDLNELPMSEVWHNELRAQAVWLSPSDALDWAVCGNLNVYRRHGTENIFGDASSNIYPQICSLEMYADNNRNVSVSGLVARHTRQWRLWVHAGGGYSHRREVYIDPYASRLQAAGYGGAAMGYTRASGRLLWRGIVSAFAAGHRGMGCSADTGINLAVTGTQAIDVAAHYLYISGYRSLDLSLALYF